MAWFKCQKCNELCSLESLMILCNNCSYCLCRKCYQTSKEQCTKCEVGIFKPHTKTLIRL